MVFHHHFIHFLWPLGEFWCHYKNILLTELRFATHNCCRLFRSTDAPYCVPDQTENLESLPGWNSLQTPAEWPCVGGLACSDLGQQKCYLTTACRKCNWMIIQLANKFWFQAKPTFRLFIECCVQDPSDSEACVECLCLGSSLALCLEGENAVKRLLDVLHQEDSSLRTACYGKAHSYNGVCCQCPVLHAGAKKKKNPSIVVN